MVIWDNYWDLVVKNLENEMADGLGILSKEKPDLAKQIIDQVDQAKLKSLDFYIGYKKGFTSREDVEMYNKRSPPSEQEACKLLLSFLMSYVCYRIKEIQKT